MIQGRKMRAAAVALLVSAGMASVAGAQTREKGPWWPNVEWGAGDQAGASNRITPQKIVQAVAQMLTRVGINSKVETAPMGPYSGRASKQEFSFHMVGWGASTGEASSPLRSLLATFNRDKGLGAVNWGRYSNVKVDYLIEQALQQVDDENRRTMLQRATELAMSDLGLMPVHFQFTIWATKKNVQYTPRTDEYTLAFQFRPTAKQP